MRSLLPHGYTTFSSNHTYGLGDVSPRRAHLQGEAARAQESQARVMHRDVFRGRTLSVGSIFQTKIPDLDRGKLDSPHLTSLVIEVCQWCCILADYYDMICVVINYLSKTIPYNIFTRLRSRVCIGLLQG
jgi:hypothetical protein